MKIIIDTREQQPWTFRRPLVTTLKTGDYSVIGFEDVICIERKAKVAEIAANFIQDRFWNEMERMSSFKKKVMICEFTEAQIAIYPKGSNIPRWRQRYIRVKPPYLFSCIEKIRNDYGIEVLFFDDKSQANIFAKVWLENAVKELEEKKKNA